MVPPARLWPMAALTVVSAAATGAGAVASRAEPAPIAGFGSPMPETAVINATRVLQRCNVTEPAECGQLCVNSPQGCIAISWARSGCCSGWGWSADYALAPSSFVVSYSRIRPANTTSVEPVIKFRLAVPTSGVALAPRGLLRAAFDANIGYLLQVPVDDMLFWFRRRSGAPTGAGSSWGWDNAAFEEVNTAGGRHQVLGLKGSVAGAFLMGSGGVVRWDPDAASGELRRRMHAVVAGIAQCRDDDGFAAAFPKNESGYTENPNYVYVLRVATALLRAPLARCIGREHARTHQTQQGLDPECRCLTTWATGWRGGRWCWLRNCGLLLGEIGRHGSRTGYWKPQSPELQRRLRLSVGTLTGLTRCRLVHLCFCHRLVKEARFSQRQAIRSSSTATKSTSYTKVEQAKGPKSLAVLEALQLFRLFRYVADSDCNLHAIR